MIFEIMPNYLDYLVHAKKSTGCTHRKYAIRTISQTNQTYQTRPTDRSLQKRSNRASFTMTPHVTITCKQHEKNILINYLLIIIH